MIVECVQLIFFWGLIQVICNVLCVVVVEWILAMLKRGWY